MVRGELLKICEESLFLKVSYTPIGKCQTRLSLDPSFRGKSPFRSRNSTTDVYIGIVETGRQIRVRIFSTYTKGLRHRGDR